jgi:hypothetical protein
MCSQDVRKVSPTEIANGPPAGSRSTRVESICRKQKPFKPEITDLDVYCGRDKRSQSHPGNKRFRDLINAHRERYQSASLREHKTRITSDVIDIVHNYGGRFMKTREDEEEWYAMETAYVHDKVSHALRSAKDPRRPRPITRRPIKAEEPSKTEEEAFLRTLAAQEAFFEKLVQQKNPCKVYSLT